MLLRVVDDGVFRDIHINEGEMFLLPGMPSTFHWVAEFITPIQEIPLIILSDLLIQLVL
jgi:hypothetical protein